MKKLICILSALLMCLISAVSGCADTSDGSFTILDNKPWANEGINYEKCTYDYEKLDKDGKVAATGIYTVTISSSLGVTTIESRLDVSNEYGSSDSVYSSVACDSATLIPQTVSKRVINYVMKEGKLTDNGYVLNMNYKEKTASFSFNDQSAEKKDDIALPDSGADTFDSEQYYQIVRSARNLGTEKNSGAFNLFSGVDSFIAGKPVSFPIKYIVGSETVLTCKKLGQTVGGSYGVNPTGSILCRKVTAQVNADQSGSATTIMFASDAFGNASSEPGTRASGKNVIVCISRPQYSISSFGVEYTHTYTLSDYTAY